MWTVPWNRCRSCRWPDDIPVKVLPGWKDHACFMYQETRGRWDLKTFALPSNEYCNILCLVSGGWCFYINLYTGTVENFPGSQHLIASYITWCSCRTRAIRVYEFIQKYSDYISEELLQIVTWKYWLCQILPGGGHNAIHQQGMCRPLTFVSYIKSVHRAGGICKPKAVTFHWYYSANAIYSSGLPVNVCKCITKVVT